MDININLGRGLKFGGNKIITDWVDDSNVDITSSGILVHDLTGAPGSGSATVEGTDDWTVTLQGTSRLKSNRSVVQYIFSMSAYRVSNRITSSYAVDYNTLKTKSDVITELNYGLSKNPSYTSYNMIVGDLLMFRRNGMPIWLWGSSATTIDDGNRYPNTPCLALFHVESVTKNSNDETTDVGLRCLWSDLSGYTKGTLLT